MMRRLAMGLLMWAGVWEGVGAEGLPGALAVPDRGKREVRLVTWNILGGRGPGGTHPHEGLAEVIRILQADAVALQEVDVKTTRAKGVDLVARLAELTGMRGYFAEAMPFQGGSYGEAVLTRFKVGKEERVALPAAAGYEPRAMLALELQPEFGGKPFWFAGVHLDHQDDGVRSGQVREMLRFFGGGGREGMAAVVAGDFNAGPEAASLGPLVKGWKLSWPGGKAEPTWPAVGPKEAIDHLFFGPAGRWEVVRVLRGDRVFPDSAAWKARLEALSDHLPVVVEAVLKP